MRTVVCISADLSQDKRAALAAICPDGERGAYGYDVRLNRTDPRLPQLLEKLREVGYRQWSGVGRRDYGSEYRFGLIREYDSSDFAAAEYAEFRPEATDSVAYSDRDEQGRLRLERPTLKNAFNAQLDFAHTILGAVLVREEIRDLLVEQGFRCLQFHATVLVSGRGAAPARYAPIPWDHYKVTRPWWELTSDTRMPMLSPTMDLRDWNGNPIKPGDYSRGCSPREGFYNRPELHYRRSDLAKMEPFDVALTYESFGPPSDDRHGTIVSKRFYDFCQANGLRGRWAPVRIDE